jgi:CheY-like chemotaxis protein
MASGDGKAVLIVEDEPDVREAMAMLLGLKGYEVREAADGQSALDTMYEEAPDAVILDLTMPVMDGWTVRQHMRAHPRLSRVPVIVVSGVADVGPELRDCAVLKKPVDADRLLREVDRCMAEATPG